MKKYRMSWEEVLKRIRHSLILYYKPYPKKIKVYGVPKGGMIAAGFLDLTKSINVPIPEEADIILDDIIDSGKTKKKYTKYKKPFVTLVGKNEFDGWVEFPWEKDKQDDIEDNLIRICQYFKEPYSNESLQILKNKIKNLLLIINDPKGGMD